MQLAFARGAGQGEALGWTWNRVTAFRYAAFTRAGALERNESFEGGWHSPNPDAAKDNAPFLLSLDVPSSALGFHFGAFIAHEVPTAFESFERHWRLPALPPADIGHQGNETAFASWDQALVMVFAGAEDFDGFEHGWASDEHYILSLTPEILTAALFDGTSPAEDYDWADAYLFGFASLNLSAAAFLFDPAEDFTPVIVDQSVTFAPPSTIGTLTAPGAADGSRVTFYSTGDGALPPEIDPRRRYFVLSHTSGSFVVSASASGAALVFSAASGSNFVKSDPALAWTLTDVGI